MTKFDIVAYSETPEEEIVAAINEVTNVLELIADRLDDICLAMYRPPWYSLLWYRCTKRFTRREVSPTQATCYGG
jgi:hypothetical protein